jgi:multidrug efflux pump subunit AcrB
MLILDSCSSAKNYSGGKVQNHEIQELVAAQNRTTHAVRAIGAFFIYSAVFGLVGGVIIGISYSVALNSWDGLSSGMGGISFGAFVVGVGYLVGVIVGVSEFRKSRVDGNRAVSSGNAVEPSSSTGTELPDGFIECRHCQASNVKNRARCRVCGGLLS